jgi:hypothetical protein
MKRMFQDNLLRASEGENPVCASSSQTFTLAEASLKLRRLREAIRLFHLAEQSGFNADACASGRWMCHMLAGDFDLAWNESDSIDERQNHDPNRFWTGHPLTGTRVLVRCLHGLGDTIQFVRYLPLLKQTAAAVYLEAQPLLKELLELSGLADKTLTWGDPEPAWEQQVEVIELPRIFRTTCDRIPVGVPYLRTSSENGTTPVAVTGLTRDKLKVGIVWESSNYNPERSVPLASVAKACALPNVQLYSFQQDPTGLALTKAFAVTDFYDQSGSVLEAARRLQTMDLVITVDTMMAHLAGALALQCWTLLPFEADWRWMVGRSDSPWYPTMRLFRQEKQGSWEEPLREVAENLRTLVDTTSTI